MSKHRQGRLHATIDGKNYWVRTDGDNTLRVTTEENKASHFNFEPNPDTGKGFERIYGTEQKVHAISNTHVTPNQNHETVYGTPVRQTGDAYNFEWLVFDGNDSADQGQIKATRQQLNGYIWTVQKDPNNKDPKQDWDLIFIQPHLIGSEVLQTFYLTN